MKRPNPIAASQLTAMERRAELCGILALGVIRLQMRTSASNEGSIEDSSLHIPTDPIAHAASTQRRSP